MAVDEQIEMLENQLYVGYRTYYDAYGSQSIPEGSAMWIRMEELWSDLEALLREEKK